MVDRAKKISNVGKKLPDKTKSNKYAVTNMEDEMENEEEFAFGNKEDCLENQLEHFMSNYDELLTGLNSGKIDKKTGLKSNKSDPKQKSNKKSSKDSLNPKKQKNYSVDFNLQKDSTIADSNKASGSTVDENDLGDSKKSKKRLRTKKSKSSDSDIFKVSSKVKDKNNKSADVSGLVTQVPIGSSASVYNLGTNKDKEKTLQASNTTVEPSVLTMSKNDKSYEGGDDIQNLTSIQEIKDYYEYTENCLKMINTMRIPDESEIEDLFLDLPEKYTKKKLAIFDLDETLIHCELKQPQTAERLITVTLPSKKKARVRLFIKI